jgi:ferredoxin
MSSQVEITVDRIRCDGRGLCAELLPELIRLDDWGYPIIAQGPVPEHLQQLAQKAVSACPVLALTLRQAARRPRVPAKSQISWGGR